jgi:hypothetical protein
MAARGAPGARTRRGVSSGVWRFVLGEEALRLLEGVGDRFVFRHPGASAVGGGEGVGSQGCFDDVEDFVSASARGEGMRGNRLEGSFLDHSREHGSRLRLTDLGENLNARREQITHAWPQAPVVTVSQCSV